MSLVSALGGCAFPAGAPVQATVLAEAERQDGNFQVVAVTRENLPLVAGWPVTGWRGHYYWPQTGGGAEATLIRPGDHINLVIWDNQQNSLLTTPNAKSTAMNGLEVSPAGTIFVPYVGEVVINGLSPDAARKVVQKEVERIAPSAQVQLVATPGQHNTVDLVRGVPHPGPVELPSRNFTILSLIAKGGGISPKLRNPLVRLIRGGKTYEIRAEDLFADPARNIIIRGGDKVVIDEDGRYFVTAGAMGNSVRYFQRERISAMEALSMSGGLNETRADPKGILILREYPAKAVDPKGLKGPKKTQVVFTIDLTSADGLFAARDFQINPGDLVLATESPMVGITQTIALASEALTVRSKLGF
ncbi:MAG: polysaccharide export protein [Alphaproteobacteria bacterium]|nr:MAG: polysaccharide export protein [Alphaproteobacteria bacterium]